MEPVEVGEDAVLVVQHIASFHRCIDGTKPAFDALDAAFEAGLRDSVISAPVTRRSASSGRPAERSASAPHRISATVPLELGHRPAIARALSASLVSQLRLHPSQPSPVSPTTSHSGSTRSVEVRPMERPRSWPIRSLQVVRLAVARPRPDPSGRSASVGAESASARPAGSSEAATGSGSLGGVCSSSIASADGSSVVGSTTSVRCSPSCRLLPAVERRIGQRGRTADRRGELAVDLRSGFDRLARREVVDQRFEALGRQVLERVGADRTIGALTQAPRHSTSSHEKSPSAKDGTARD